MCNNTQAEFSAPIRNMPYEPLGGLTVRPWLKGPSVNLPAVAQDDHVLQGIVGPAVATSPGLNILGVGNGFTGPNGTFTVQYAPPDTKLPSEPRRMRKRSTYRMRYSIRPPVPQQPDPFPSTISGQMWIPHAPTRATSAIQSCSTINKPTAGWWRSSPFLLHLSIAMPFRKPATPPAHITPTRLRILSDFRTTRRSGSGRMPITKIPRGFHNADQFHVYRSD